MDPLAHMPQPATLKPRLPALRVATGPSAGGLVAWCPFCEGLHHHGGQRGERARHCTAEAGTPFAAYDLTDGGGVDRSERALPAGLFVATGHTLRGALQRRGAELRRALSCILLDLCQIEEPTLHHRGRRGSATVTVEDRTGCGSAHLALPADDWTVKTRGKPERSGRGALDLAAALFGVPASVVALRALEAVLGLRLDAQAATGVCSAVAAWDARGRPGPDDGPWPHRA